MSLCIAIVYLPESNENGRALSIGMRKLKKDLNDKMATGVGGGDDLSHSQLNAGDELFNHCCTPCQKRNKNRAALKYCAVCLEYMCAECVDNHNSFQALSDHTLVDVSQVQVLSGNATTSNQLLSVPTEMCKNHPMKVMDMYCENDDCIGCSVCIAPHYKSCSDIHYIPEYVKSVALGAISHQTVTDLAASINNVSSLKQLQNKLKKTLDNDRADCKQKIKNYRMEIKKVVDQLEQTSLKELDEAYRTIGEEIANRIKNIETIEKELARLKREIEVTHDNDSQKFAVTKVIQEMITESVKLASTLNMAENTTLDIDENIAILQQLQQYESFQKCLRQQSSSSHSPDRATSSSLQSTAKSISSTSQTPLVLSPTSQSAARLKSLTLQSPARLKSPTLQSPDNVKPPSLQTPGVTKGRVKRKGATKLDTDKPQSHTDKDCPIDTTTRSTSDTHTLYKVKHMHKHSVRITSDHKTCSIDSVCILDNDNLILVDSENRVIKRFDVNTHKVTASLELSSRPNGVCKVNGEEVAVSLCGSEILFVDTKDKLSQKRKFTTLCTCWGLVIIENKLYICDDDTSVHVYTMNGDLIKTMRVRSSNVTDSNLVYNYIAFSSTKNIVFTCDPVGVSVLDLEGHVIWQHDQKYEAHVKGTTSVCCDGRGRLFVSGFLTGNVVLVNQNNGAYIKEIAAWHDGLTLPTAMCYDAKKQQLIVGMNKSDDLFVLSF